MTLDEAGVEIARGKGRMGGDAAEEFDVGDDAGQVDVGQRALEAAQGLAAIALPDHQLGDHGIVVGRHQIALDNAGVDPHVRPLGRHLQPFQAAGRGQEAFSRVLGIKPHLDGVALAGHLVLA